MARTIFEAAAAGDMDELKRLVETGKQDINQKFEEERSPHRVRAMNVLWYGKKIVGSGVIFFGGICAFGGPVGWIIAGVASLLGFLIYRAGNDSTAQYTYNRNGWTALHFAAAAGQFEAAKYLIEHGADVTLDAQRGVVSFLQLAENLHTHDPISNNWNFVNRCYPVMIRKVQEQRTQLTQDKEENASRSDALITRLLNDNRLTTQEKDALREENRSLKRDRARLEAKIAKFDEIIRSVNESSRSQREQRSVSPRVPGTQFANSNSSPRPEPSASHRHDAPPPP